MHLEQRFIFSLTIFLISICAASSKPWEERLNYVPNAFKVAEPRHMNTIRNQYCAWYSPTNTIFKVYCLCAELILWRETIREREKSSHRIYMNVCTEEIWTSSHRNVHGKWHLMYFMLSSFSFSAWSPHRHTVFVIIIFLEFIWWNPCEPLYGFRYFICRDTQTHAHTHTSIFHRDTPCDVQLLCWNHDSVPCWVSVCFVCFELDWTKWNCFHFIELQSFEYSITHTHTQ